MPFAMLISSFNKKTQYKPQLKLKSTVLPVAPLPFHEWLIYIKKEANK